MSQSTEGGEEVVVSEERLTIACDVFRARYFERTGERLVGTSVRAALRAALATQQTPSVSLEEPENECICYGPSEEAPPEPDPECPVHGIGKPLEGEQRCGGEGDDYASDLAKELGIPDPFEWGVLSSSGVEGGFTEEDAHRESAEHRLAEAREAVERVRAELRARADHHAATIGKASAESELRARHEEQALRAALSFFDAQFAALDTSEQLGGEGGDGGEERIETTATAVKTIAEGAE